MGGEGAYLIADNRCSGLNIIIDVLRHIVGTVDTAMGTIGFIDITPERPSPAGIMYPDPTVKWHPKGDGCSVARSPQYHIFCLIF